MVATTILKIGAALLLISALVSRCTIVFLSLLVRVVAMNTAERTAEPINIKAISSPLVRGPCHRGPPPQGPDSWRLGPDP